MEAVREGRGRPLAWRAARGGAVRPWRSLRHPGPAAPGPAAPARSLLAPLIYKKSLKSQAYLLEVPCKLVRSVKLFLTLLRLAST